MGVRRIDTTPRKMPRQERAKMTVEAIIAATAQVLIEHGYERTTTARVAERAGISVGSLYQYFPSKEALVATLIEHHADQMIGTMRRALEDPGHATLADGLGAIIKAATAAHRIKPALQKVLHEEIPRIGGLAEATNVHRKITAAIERFLHAHVNEIAVDCKLSVLAIIIETVLESLIHKAVIDQHELLADGLIERETFRLIMSYLTAATSSK
jgi:AcrR family transcriptional regulator